MSTITPKTPKCRLDSLVLSRGLAASRAKARALIMAGRITSDGLILQKAGQLVKDDIALAITENDCPYVGRGGLKLASAMRQFEISVDGLDCLDAGSSTGGFTDCLLQNGAASVIAIDVGYGQLDWTLRKDSRVVVLERINIRYLKVEQIPYRVDLVTADLSFISLKLLLSPLKTVLKDNSMGMVVLVKPQFEAGRRHVGKGGIVKLRNIRHAAVGSVARAAAELGLAVRGVSASDTLGAKGNQEYFLWLQPQEIASNSTIDWQDLLAALP